MQFCKECGHELKKDAQFCPECGTPIGGSQKPPTVQQPETPKSPRQITLKQKIIVASVAAIVLLVFGGYQIGASITNPERLINRFEEALQEQDANALASLLESSDSRLEITSAGVENLLEVIAASPSSQPYYVDTLRSQAEAFKNNDSVYGDTIFTLKKEGKSAIFYDRYIIEVTPFYFSVSTNMVDTEIAFGDEVIAISDQDDYSKEHGPVLPGVYQLTATYQNEFATLETTNQLSLLNPYDQDYHVNLPLHGDYISLNTEYGDLALEIEFFINDDAITVEQEETFGPVSTDGTLSTHASLSFPWGKVTSEVTPIDRSYIYLEVPKPFTSDLEEALIEMIHTFGEEYAALHDSPDDFSVVTVATDELLNGALADSVDDSGFWHRYWTGEHVKTMIDLDSFYLEHYNDTYYAYVETRIVFNSATAYDEEDLDEAELDEENNDWQIEFVYDEAEDAWLINHYQNLWSFSENNVMEIER